jgi:hypothetical protein
MPAPTRLTDGDMFAARPWRAADRSQVIVAVVQAQEPRTPETSWHVVLATLEGSTIYARQLEGQRTPASFSDAELQALFDEANGRVPR